LVERIVGKRSWTFQFIDLNRWAAVGTVLLDDQGRYISMFLKPRDLRRPPEQKDWDFIGPFETLSAAKKSVEGYAKKNGYVKAYRWTKWE
jgi:hypothetical protein